jgi:putative transposase
VAQPSAAWVGDITYIWTLEGWLYLAVILDLYSRRVVGWAMSHRIDQALTLRALRMALDTCEPGAGLVHHTDRASQYAANDYRTLLKARGITCSMSGKGNCWERQRGRPELLRDLESRVRSRDVVPYTGSGHR